MSRRHEPFEPWLPLVRNTPAVAPPSGEAFQTEWIDLRRGIRVGRLQPNERITQILKYHLENRYRTAFVTERWGRGMYWRWICWLPRANRDAKPLSHDVNFGCAKLFISVDSEQELFKSGLQVERGYAAGPEAAGAWGLRPDFDWHRLLRQCRPGTELASELRRLVEREGFVAAVLTEDAADTVFARQLPIRRLRTALQRCPADRWAGFQLYYPLRAAELYRCSGLELVQAICSVFDELVRAMNCCMQIRLQRSAVSTPAARFEL